MNKFFIRYFLGFILTLSLVVVGTISYASNSNYEIWMSDQGNTQGITATNPKGSYGGKVRIYVALRGTLPQSVAHAAVGSCPGLGIIDLENKKAGRLTHVLPTFIESGDTRDNLSDPHAVILVKN